MPLLPPVIWAVFPSSFPIVPPLRGPASGLDKLITPCVIGSDAPIGFNWSFDDFAPTEVLPLLSA
jgi:hypothetical protein